MSNARSVGESEIWKLRDDLKIGIDDFDTSFRGKMTKLGMIVMLHSCGPRKVIKTKCKLK